MNSDVHLQMDRFDRALSIHEEESHDQYPDLGQYLIIVVIR
jgi:hypothetical protein